MSTDEYVNQINQAQDITSLTDVIVRANLDEDLSCEEAHTLRTHLLKRKQQLIENTVVS